jgi:hypothetical protein
MPEQNEISGSSVPPLMPIEMREHDEKTAEETSEVFREEQLSKQHDKRRAEQGFLTDMLGKETPKIPLGNCT